MATMRKIVTDIVCKTHPVRRISDVDQVIRKYKLYH